jgi:hypothetical protein
VLGVDLVIRIHPGVDGVFDIEKIGRGHDDLNLMRITHTRDEYNIVVK